MRGTLRWKDGAWRLQVSAPGIDNKRRFVTRTVRAPNTRTGRREAESALAKLVAEVEAGQLAATAPPTVGQVIERWLTLRSADWSPKTAVEMRGHAARHVTPAIGHLRVDRLRVAHLDALYAAQRDAGLSPGTVRQTHKIVHAALEQARRWGLVTTNVAGLAEPPKVGRAKVRPPERDELGRLLAAVEGQPELWCWLRVAAVTGARRGTVCALRWPDIDFDAGTVTFTRALTLGDGVVVEKSTKTDRPYRIALDADTVAALRAHRTRMAERAMAAGRRLAVDGFVFSPPTPPDGTVPWRPDSTSRRFARIARRAGVEGVRLHDLRHFVATQLLAAGVDVRTVAGRLGQSGTLALSLYGHFVPAADRVAAQRIADVVDGKG
ncbi:MAG TPA: site-specific integrase [Acidimicrobiales bacterium]